MNSWPVISFGDVLRKTARFEERDELTEYQFAGTYSFGRGIFRGNRKSGSSFQLPKIQRVRQNDFVYCKIMAWEGAFGVAPANVDDCVLSGAFVVYEIDRSKLEPRFIDYYFQNRSVWERIGSKSTGTNVRRKSLHPEQFEAEKMPLPALSEQQKIVAKIESLVAKINEARQLRQEILTDARAMLQSTFQQLIEGAKYRPMAEIAPIVRRKVEIDMDGEYPELGARSFGKGIFHKPTLIGAELDWQKLYHVQDGDLVISNIKAWEGAIAVASRNDHDRVGSHRYITCVPKEGVATANYLCFYLLTEAGLGKVQAASPGSADRNRTLAMKRLEKIEVPVLNYDKQIWFNSLQAKVAAIQQAQAENQTELDALLPAILDRAFRGEL